MFTFWVIFAVIWLCIGVAIDRTEVSQRERNRIFNERNYSNAVGATIAVLSYLFWPWRVIINKLNGEHPFT